ncbi:ABC transporter ATP-binding protein [Pseudooceanicola sp. CBS1P-1]|uniref:ATP-binding cassette domain-containing protein n=1 Tax=Pseudooceanicola albus TaxID=2692189 RepID=A0A6L7G3G4_9RHOB|nr:MULTISPECIES: ABC transporter ATP-binding protein [Pseudooceanicola]MBT9385247.1 ABC transporter ATP-binding protein [Pseudooceanicola endophyticus]MXN18894.1 ATP-binding cassette domain-containing protein [Pseudooceanicola albus]
MTTAANLDIIGVAKSYGTFTALDNVSLAIQPGEFLTLLGPSGSGKTTLLMSLAGFVRPTRGHIVSRGKDLAQVPPHKRNFGMVFQSYSLFPHMNVAENVAYPLKLRKVSKSEITERVTRALELVQLAHLADRPIAKLSGGQKQRIALARAVVFSPDVLLMDEPLSALDKNLREAMQFEIRNLHDKLGITTVYVTHDQREALTMSDRIAVLKSGRIAQIGAPREIYDYPTDSFVAEFLGESTLLPVESRGSQYHFAGTPLRVEAGSPDARFLMVRPESSISGIPPSATATTVSMARSNARSSRATRCRSRWCWTAARPC